MLAEDDPGDQELIRRALEKQCICDELRIVEDGHAALDYLLRRGQYEDPLCAPRPDLVLLDLNMPKVDGWQVLEEIQQHRELCYLPVVVLTTSSRSEDRQRSCDLGARAFFTKPADFDQFKGMVSELRRLIAPSREQLTMPTGDRRYLVIDDDPGDIELMRRLLERLSEGRAEVLAAADPTAALAELRSREFDLIFVDYMLGATDGLQVLAEIRSQGCEQPVVLLTGQGSEEIAVDAMKAGVADYVVKGNLDLGSLQRVVANALAKFELQRQIRQQQEQLADRATKLAQLNEQKNRFLGIAAHDLRNPLGAVRAMAQLATSEDNGLSEAQCRLFFSRIRSTCDHMLAMVDEMLDVSVIESGQLVLKTRVLSLQTLVDAAVEQQQPFADAKSIRIEVRRPAEPLMATFDLQRMLQVLGNLLSNAIKYSPTGSGIVVSFQQRGDACEITVEDQGVGIAEDEQHRLFRDFGRTSARPTAGERSVGLGLAICQRIVTAHGGAIHCKSREGEGSRFTVELPLK